MNILILGGDGYLGWPTAMHFAARGHNVVAIDNYLRRTIAKETDSEPLISTPGLPERAGLFEEKSGHKIETKIGDLSDPDVMFDIVKQSMPDAIVHYAEQPSGPYSMKAFDEARRTLQNNLDVTFNCIWAIKESNPDCHLIKLGTMGEYGTPNIDIEEGYITITHNGRKHRFLFPRAASTLYHTTKVLDTDLLSFYVRTYDLRVTDLMQGPVYGLSTPEADLDPRLCPNFHYDDIFGTVVNRFVVQAIAGVPLSVYGKGGQTRGYLNLLDTLQCIELAVNEPANRQQLRILNQFTETFSVVDLAQQVKSAAKQMDIDVTIEHQENPRKEMEDHYYNPVHTGLTKLGLKPNYLSDDVLLGMMKRVKAHKDNIDTRIINPRIRWS